MKLFFINIFLLFILVGFSNWCLSQPGQWTWIKGDSTSNNLGVYGIQGVSSPANNPPSLYEPCEFKDLNGNFWLYGGLNINGGSYSALNDLWKYNSAANEWTWMKGTHTYNTLGIFGVQGVPSPNNLPPSVSWGATSWVDNNGYFWLYGGLNYTYWYGDLWKYDPTSNEWTWMKGNGTISPSPIYGTMTIPNAANTPGALEECSAAWTDSNNDLWFFGGAISGLYVNNLWRYNIATNTWTWMKGSGANNPMGQWGTMGVENSSNVPSGRFVFAHWKDNLGNFWIFGGHDVDINGITTEWNDLWRFNPITNNWTWMSGSNLPSTNTGNYGTKCIATASNCPSGRFENRAVWTDANGDFWMFGGTHLGLSLNDLWKYCVTQYKWIWMSGDSIPNTQGSYGIMGVSNPANFPGGRIGSVGWMSSNNILYLFGGSEGPYNNFFNDLWKFDIDTTCAPCAQNGFIPDALFNLNNNAFCEGTCIALNNQSVNASSYLWLFPGGTPSSSNSANPQNICYFTQGNYSVTLIASNNFGSDTLTINNAITVYPPVAFSPINQIGDTLFSVPGYMSYQWYIDSTLINGAANYYYTATQSGNYSVHVIDSNGCTAAATLINVEVSVDNISHSNFDFKVQIFDHSILLDIYSNKLQTSDIQVTDELGKEIYHKKLNLAAGKNNLELKNINLSSGIYFIKIYSSEGILTKKLFFK